MYTENINDTIEKNNISWIQLHFNDIFGRLKVLHIPAERFIKDDILNKGFTFDGSSVGYADVDKSDMICIPDPSSFLILPQEKDEARIISEIYNTNIQRSNLDSRYALKKVLEKARIEGFDEVKISPEMEFFLMHNEKKEFDESNYNSYFSSVKKQSLHEPV